MTKWDGLTPKLCRVYALVDPRDAGSEIRYVGLATTSAKRRYSGHLNEARKGVVSWKCAWIRKLGRLELIPILTILEEREMTWEELCDREIYWIAHYRAEGHRLTNATNGGGGVVGFAAPRTPEWRDNLSAARRSYLAIADPEDLKTTEAKRQATLMERYGTVHIGQFADPKGFGNGTRGKKHSPELIEKMREGQRRKWERIRNEGRYEEVCGNIATATQEAMDRMKGDTP